MLLSDTSIQLGVGTLSTVKVARNPILTAESSHTLLGYELLFSDSGGLFNAFAEVDEFRATSEVVSHSVLTLGVDAVVGTSLAFVRFPRAQIMDSTPMILPPPQSVIELGPDAWGVLDVDGMVAHCQEYKAKGYAIALADFTWTPRVAPLVAVADYIKVDLAVRPIDAVMADIARLAATPAKVVAVNVDDEAARDLAVAVGVDYLQGFFFSQPGVVVGRELPGFKMAYLQLLQKAYALDVDYQELAEVIKSDVALSYKLLRYINSAHFGLRGQVESVQRALVMLGVDNVRRWVSVATVSGLTDPRPQELAVLCATRARFCESLGEKLGVSSPHDAFSLGMFSLLDVMLGRSMEEALADVPVAPAVDAALLGRTGELSDLLEVVVNYERGGWDTVSALAASHGWPETELIGLYIEAIEWSRDFFGAPDAHG